MGIGFRFRSGYRTSFLVARSTSVACFVSSRTPARLSQVARCFQMLWTSSSRAGCCGCCCCCCCCLPITLQRDLGCWPWCCESFEYYSISVLRKHTIDAISWHCGVSDDCKWCCLSESQYLILRSWQFYPINRILIAFPISFICVPFEEQCNHNDVLLLPGGLRMD